MSIILLCLPDILCGVCPILDEAPCKKESPHFFVTRVGPKLLKKLRKIYCLCVHSKSFPFGRCHQEKVGHTSTCLPSILYIELGPIEPQMNEFMIDSRVGA